MGVLNSFDQYTRNQKLILFAGFFLIPPVGVLDFLTGGEIPAALFYLAPIYYDK